MRNDKKLVESRFATHLDSYNRYAKVQRLICKYLCNKLIQFLPTITGRIVEVGAGTGFLTKEILKNIDKKRSTIYINDITPEIYPYIEDIRADKEVNYIFGDAEKIDLPQDIDLFVSANSIQWLDDISLFIDKLDIKEEGFLAISTFGKQNFIEIKESIGIGLNYPTLQEIRQYTERCGYRVLFSEDRIERVSFKDPIEVLRHIKLTGVNAIGHNTFWSRGKLNSFCEEYIKSYGKDGDVTLTYNPLIIICQRTPKGISSRKF